MDIKKFLKDNKGCPLTVPAIKQLLVKFIELLSKKGVVKDEVSNIQQLSKETLDELQVGDIVQKITGNQKHAYMVTYKGEGAGEGICLTYCAAGYMETVSYDRSGSDWVYNSTDVVNIEEALADKQDKLVSGENIKTVGGESLLGSGNIPLPSGGTQLYKHTLALTGKSSSLILFDNNSEVIPPLSQGGAFRIKTALGGSVTATAPGGINGKLISVDGTSNLVIILVDGTLDTSVTNYSDTVSSY